MNVCSCLMLLMPTEEQRRARRLPPADGFPGRGGDRRTVRRSATSGSAPPDAHIVSRQCRGMDARCPTTARPAARPETSHSLGLPDLPDLSWNRETSSSSGEGRRLGSSGSRVLCLPPAELVGQVGQSGSWLKSRISAQVGQQVGQLPDLPGWISRRRLPATRH